MPFQEEGAPRAELAPRRAATAALAALVTRAVLLLMLLGALLLQVGPARAAPPADQPAGPKPAGVAPPLRRGADAMLAKDSDDEREQMATQIANVHRLLDVSSGAKRVMSSDDELAHRIREDAIGKHKAAQEAWRSGDYPEARRLLDEAAKTMFQAIRILGPANEVVQKKIADFEGRAESTRVLLEALQRIAKDEGAQGPAAKTVAGVQKTVAAAREMLAAGRHDDARKLLDGGYEIAKVAVEGLRDGKTLVRSLHFANAEEEYRYELDRNDTHQMLVKVVVGEKQPDARATALVDEAVQRATVLRRQAEQRADGQAFREAIQLLEKSTSELVRAIRSAGLYIPG